MSQLIIRNMRESEVQIAIDWAKQEGWNPGLNDAELFYLADPNGFFVGEINNQIVAVGSAVKYSEQYAFCGLYIVAPEYRGNGYGLALTKHRLAYCQDANIGIDGVLENVEIYQRLGYVPFYQNTRYQKKAVTPTTLSPNIKTVDKSDIADIIKYDEQCFAAKREQFLTAWLLQPNGNSVCFIENGIIRGFAVRRKCVEGHKIGPLFADSRVIANQLFSALQAGIDDDLIIIDVPGNNPNAVALAQSADMESVFATSRMYQHGEPTIATEKVYGITTFELG